MTKREKQLKEWANSLPKDSIGFDVDVREIPGVCNLDGTIKKSYLENHGYYFQYRDNLVYKAYTNAGFSYLNYNEITYKMTLKWGRPSNAVHGVKNAINSFPAKLREYDDSLISFYIAETKSILTKQQYDALSKVELVIDNDQNTYYEIVGRYDLREIIEELEDLLERNRNIAGAFIDYLKIILRILKEILELESSLFDYYLCDGPFVIFNEPFTIPNFNYYPFIAKVQKLEEDIKLLIEEIRKMLCEKQWPEATKQLIEDILNQILPKVVGRKRITTVLGTFSASSNRVTLYQFAIENWLPYVDTFKKMLDVYSHELFHAFHYIHMKNAKKWEYDDKSRIVKESLSRYIEYKFGLQNICETSISADLIRMWNDYDMYDFPYAGAKYVDKYIGLCELMFKESTNKGTQKAFHLIDTAYAIEND